MGLATEQEANLDGDSDHVRQAFSAVTTTTIPTATIQQAGGAAAAATVPKKKTITYCFLHGNRSQYSSAQCNNIAINSRAYPKSTTNFKTFQLDDQVKKTKLTTSSATEVKGIAKVN